MNRRSKLERLAFHGGPKVFSEPYAHGSKHDTEGIDALRERIKDSGQLPLAMGPSIRALRNNAQRLFNVPHAVPCSSGTSAIHTGLAALGLRPGDEVITTPVTDAGTVLGIMSLNAIPVFADVNPETLMIDAETIRPHISDKTRALLPVHYHGCPAEMGGIMEIAREHHLSVLEDCAQSWLARWHGQYVGTIGDVGAFSMNESKHVSVGEGGLIISDRADVADFAERFVDKSYRRNEDGAPGPDMVAHNYRMSELCATLALRQFEKLEWLAQKRYEFGELLADGVESLPGINLLRSPENCRSTYWFGLLQVDPDKTGVSTETFAKALAAEGVQCNFFGPRIMPQADLFRNLDQEPKCLAHYMPPGLRAGAFPLDAIPNALSIKGRFVLIRINEFMEKCDIEKILQSVRKVSQWYQAEPEGSVGSPV